MWYRPLPHPSLSPGARLAHEGNGSHGGHNGPQSAPAEQMNSKLKRPRPGRSPAPSFDQREGVPVPASGQDGRRGSAVLASGTEAQKRNSGARRRSNLIGETDAASPSLFIRPEHLQNAPIDILQIIEFKNEVRISASKHLDFSKCFVNTCYF